jgi:glutathione synthase/RimK-type ligase-like ATP-grasp enzyme
MKQIYLLTDYKGNFGSKHNAVPYRSGMNKDLLKKYFEECGFEAVFMNFSEVNYEDNWKDKIVLYTSQEDHNYHYKSYIEDIVYGLELAGANVIPRFKYLRANNNKVFLEILRSQIQDKKLKNIKSWHYGTIEELKKMVDQFSYPVVLKSAEGAMSRGVSLAKNKDELIRNAKKISRTMNIYYDLKDLGRSIKRKGYIKESKYRRKFIVQEFIPDLNNDWKILIFGERYYILFRYVRENDFRASGSHRFIFNDNSLVPIGIFKTAKRFFDVLDVPCLSIDIIYDGSNYYFTEFQAIYFGSTTHEKSDGYFKKINDKWMKINDIIDLEKVFVDSIVRYIDK